MSAAAALVGGDPAAIAAELSPIQIVLVPEGTAAARAVAPWISGYAISGGGGGAGGPGRIVLFPARVDRYPDFGLDAVLRHELTHLFVDRAAAGGDVPRWFNEGLAMAVGREAGLGDRARVALAVIDDGEPADRPPRRRLLGRRGRGPLRLCAGRRPRPRTAGAPRPRQRRADPRRRRPRRALPRCLLRGRPASA